MNKLLILIAAVIALTSGFFSYQIMEARYSYRAIWIEQAGYLQYPSLVYADKLRGEGYFETIYGALKSGQRHLLQLLVLGVLGDKVLSWRHAHLLIVVPALAVFLFLMAKVVLSRSKSMILAISSIFLFAAAPGFLSGEWGMGTGFADWQSMLLLFAAVFSLIMAFDDRSVWWIRLFAIFSSLSVLARGTAVFFEAVILGPILTLYFFKKYQKGEFKQIRTSTTNIILISLPALFIVATQLPNLIWYYTSSVAWTLRHSAMDSVVNTVIYLRFFLGRPMMIVLVLVGLLSLFGRGKPKLKAADIVIWWSFLGFWGFLIANGYTSDVPKEVMYMVPAILVLALTPLAVFKSKAHSAKGLTGILLITFSLISIFINYKSSMAFASKPTLKEEKIRDTQMEMAAALSGFSQRHWAWQPFVYPDWGIPVSVLTEYKYGNFVRTFENLFHNSRNYWDAYYPGLTADEIATTLHRKADICAEVVMVLKDPDVKPVDMEDYSFEIASMVAKRIEVDANWDFWRNVSGEPYADEFALFVDGKRSKDHDWCR